jgi:hypothetical protein
MLKRAHIIIVVVAFAVAPCFGAQPSGRDGSTKARAIPLKQRDPAKAVEEEMQWMMKLYRYTPILATRDAVLDSIRRVKAGKKPARAASDWGHATLDHNGRLISNWWFPSPRGKRDIYFDTGTLIRTPGEVVRQESARAQYIGKMVQKLKFQ